MKMATDVNPKETLTTALGDTPDKFRVVGSDILIAIYERPEKTSSGIYLPETGATRREERYMGKVGLVLKLGPLVAETEDWFGGKDNLPKVGDWVLVRVGDTYACDVNGVPCRLVEAKQLRGIVDQPDLVW